MDSSNPVINAAGDNKEIGLRPPERFKDMHDFIDTKRYGWLVSKTHIVFSVVMNLLVS